MKIIVDQVCEKDSNALDGQKVFHINVVGGNRDPHYAEKNLKFFQEIEKNKHQLRIIGRSKKQTYLN
jgi:hypothetical protein